MRNIRPKIMLLSSIMMLGILLSVVLGSYRVYSDSLENIIKESIERTAKESSWHLSNFLEGYLAPLNKLAENESVKTMDMDIQKEVLNNQINPNFDEIGIVDLDGFAYYLDGDVLDLSDREYIKRALSGEKNISEVLVSRKTGNLVILAAVPIIKDGETKGALIARLNMELLKNYISTRGFGESGKVYIISTGGSFLKISPDEEDVFNINIFEESEKNDEYTELSELVKNNKNSASGLTNINIKEKNYYVYHEPIKNTSWNIYVTADKESLLLEVKDLLYLIGAGTLIFFVAILYIIWRVIKKFTQPIIVLESLMDKGSKGDFNVKFETKKDDEVARLGKSFNGMLETIKKLTYYDPLTKVLNRYVLKEDIFEVIRKKETNFILIMIQINDMGIINEKLGFDISDSIILETSERINNSIQKEARLYRSKGDSFVIMINNTNDINSIISDSDAGTIMPVEIEQYILELLEKLKIKHKANKTEYEISYNIGVYDNRDSEGQVDALKAVSIATSYAKSLGKNKYILYKDGLIDTIDEMQKMLEDINIAVKNDEFFLVLQPLFNMHDNEIIKFEALIRWEHPQNGLIYPNQFIEIAETTNAIKDIDYWVIKRACEIIYKWRRNSGINTTISVNITSKTFEDKNFLDNIDEIFRKYEIMPNDIELEITERVVITNVEESIVKINQLKSRGVKLSLDDFGIGYSSLGYIVRLPIDSVKIDRSFVEHLLTNKQAKVIINTIINLCKALEFQVVAEGIELEEEYEYLKENKCDIGQGYYLSRPISIKDAKALIVGRTL